MLGTYVRCTAADDFMKHFMKHFYEKLLLVSYIYSYYRIKTNEQLQIPNLYNPFK